MAATVIDGTQVAADVVETVKRETAKLIKDTGVIPGIAVVIVGEDPASQVYVRSKESAPRNAASSRSRTALMPPLPRPILLALIAELNADPSIPWHPRAIATAQTD
ncbi:MAG: tetrahydrofolate dehydrogenase/cyclohydrolase catalytic domain-containing protein [Nitratireductor sp.]